MLRLPGPPPQPSGGSSSGTQALPRQEKHQQANQQPQREQRIHYLLVFGPEGVRPAGGGRGGAGKGFPPWGPLSSRLCMWMCHADLLRGLWRGAQGRHGPAGGGRDLDPPPPRGQGARR